MYCEPRSELNRIQFNSDAGSQYTSIRYTEHLALEQIQPSIGTVGDCLLTGQSGLWGLAA